MSDGPRLPRDPRQPRGPRLPRDPRRPGRPDPQEPKPSRPTPEPTPGPRLPGGPGPIVDRPGIDRPDIGRPDVARPGGGTVVDGRILDPIFDRPILDPDLIEQLRGEAKPLALLPLRLEYRVHGDRAGIPREIVFRWYPDDGFAEEGIEPASDDERTALDRARALLGERDWWDVNDPEVVGAFSAFAREVGATRAVALLRGVDAGAGDPDARRGHLAMLPRAVTLFAVIDDEVRELATGEPIDRAMAYSADLFEDDHWFLDIDRVVEHGMGVKLTDRATLRDALAADWIIAVGLHAGDAVAEMTSLVRDGIANGTFGFLRQDAPTNNGDGRAGAERAPHRDLAAFLGDATEHERGHHTDALRQASGLFAEAFGIDPEVVRPAVRSADTAFEDARAMLRVVLPALLEELPDVATELGSTDGDDVIDFFASWMSARGPLPAVRFGDQPYGVLPVTRLADLQPLPDDDETDRQLQRFFQGYAGAMGERLAHLADEHVPVIQPGDPDAAEALEEALKVASVSRRIDVTSADGEVRPIACPYVTHRDHDPASYLEALRTTALSRLPDPDADDTSTPLLYRLARRSATRRVARLGQLVEVEADPDVSGRLREILGRLGEVDLQVDPDIAEAVRRRRTRGTRGTRRRRGTADEDTTEDATDAPDIGGMRISERVRRRAAAEGRTFTAVSDVAGAIRSLDAIQTSSIANLADRARLEGFDAGIAARLQHFTRDYGRALRHLETVAARPDGAAQLESLLFEAIDLVQHRVDAWATGLAYRRLAARRRRAELEGLRGGYYGMIGRLRPTSATADTDGYIQAPSLEQATTAAVLRAAHLRFRDEGAFDVDLSSTRVRRALGLHQLVQRGLSLEEILGLSGERWLHERRLDRLIAVLRDRFPLRNPLDDEQVEIRLFDGRRFLDATWPQDGDAAAADRAALRELRSVLADDLDALADLVMAEAVHQRVQGNADAAHAWLQVLSGDVGPGEPTFQRTHRKGHASAHAVMLLVPGVDPAADASPREIAEPSMAAAVADALPDVGDLAVTVAVGSADTAEGVEHRADLRLLDDLGVTAWDLVVGGRDELKLRATVTFLRRWQRDAGLQSELGPAPRSVQALANERVCRVLLGDGDGSVAAVLADALTLRTAIANGRRLQVTDLHAAAPAGQPLQEADVVARLTEAGDALRDRAERLERHLDDLAQRLTRRLDAALVHARNLRRLADAAGSPGEIDDEAAALSSASRALDDVLVEASRTTEPRALLMSASTALRDAPDRYEEDGLAVLDHLADERDRLRRTLTAVTAAPTTASEARGIVRRLTEAIRGVLDGDALPVLAPLAPTGSTRPVLEATDPADQRLGPWVEARTGVRRAIALADTAGLRTFAVGDAATTDDLDDHDDRDPSLNPPSRFHGTVLSPAADPAARASVAGVVVDEWSESVPSPQQVTGLAINHDSPQNEAPNAILLCEPPATDVRQWSTLRAAQMVLETIRWMKVRALTTEVAAPTGPLLWGCNQVVMQGSGDDATPRVPWRDAWMGVVPVDGIVAGDAQFVLSETASSTAFQEAISRRER